MVIVAVLSMNLFHPGFCLQSAWNVRANEKGSGSTTDVEVMEHGHN